MLPPSDATYFISWYQWQDCNYYSLWWTAAEADGLWADDAGCVPLYSSPDVVRQLADALGVQLVAEEPSLQNLDSILYWLSHPAKNPPKEALAV